MYFIGFAWFSTACIYSKIYSENASKETDAKQVLDIFIFINSAQNSWVIIRCILVKNTLLEWISI